MTTGRKRKENGNNKNWISGEQEELFTRNKNPFS